jgi:bifunctional UDP-N-acetylglucosamine pyrophosphorylase/glucosamine-1-phosphate N-acetyltransferase
VPIRDAKGLSRSVPADRPVPVVLAAGQGTRMKSPLPKVLHRVAGRTMIDRVVSTLEASGIARIVVVVGFGRRAVEEELDATHPGISTVVQGEQLGTGHAVRCALPVLDEGVRTVGVFSGDTPLLTPATVYGLMREHLDRSAALTLLTAVVADPEGYGRIIRSPEDLVERIVEQIEAGDAERAVREINAGAYIFAHHDLRMVLEDLRTNNVRGEYYLTDAVGLLRARGRTVAAMVAAGEAFDVLGVNTLEQLLQAEQLLRERAELRV